MKAASATNGDALRAGWWLAQGPKGTWKCNWCARLRGCAATGSAPWTTRARCGRRRLWRRTGRRGRRPHPRRETDGHGTPLDSPPAAGSTAAWSCSRGRSSVTGTASSARFQIRVWPAFVWQTHSWNRVHWTAMQGSTRLAAGDCINACQSGWKVNISRGVGSFGTRGSGSLQQLTRRRTPRTAAARRGCSRRRTPRPCDPTAAASRPHQRAHSRSVTAHHRRHSGGTRALTSLRSHLCREAGISYCMTAVSVQLNTIDVVSTALEQSLQKDKATIASHMKHTAKSCILHPATKVQLCS